MNKGVITYSIMLVALMGITVLSKIYYSSRNEYKLAEQAFKNGDYRVALRHFDRSLRWYLPKNKYPLLSAERLFEIGNIAEQEEDEELAISAYRVLRSSSHGTKHISSPFSCWIDKCNMKIAALMESIDVPIEKHLNLLKKEAAPNVLWSIVTEFSLFGWIGCVILFIITNYDDRSRIRQKKTFFWIGILLYITWIIGMLNC